MSFLTAEKKDHVARCPGGGGGKTYLGNGRLKTFFSVDAFLKQENISKVYHILDQCRKTKPKKGPVKM